MKCSTWFSRSRLRRLRSCISWFLISITVFRLSISAGRLRYAARATCNEDTVSDGLMSMRSVWPADHTNLQLVVRVPLALLYVRLLPLPHLITLPPQQLHLVLNTQNIITTPLLFIAIKLYHSSDIRWQIIPSLECRLTSKVTLMFSKRAVISSSLVWCCFCRSEITANMHKWYNTYTSS